MNAAQTSGASAPFLERIGLAHVPRRPDAAAYSASQAQTQSAFGFKWSKRDTYDSPAMKDACRQWLFERYCGGDPSQLDRWLAGGRKVILDAGCGAGLSGMLVFENHLRDHDYLGVDISEAADVARQRFAEAGLPGEFFQSSFLDIPIRDGSLDMIFAEGVLHHTDSTERSIAHLATKLKQDGRFLFYVYVKKADIREFTDDHIRAKLAPLSDEQAWEQLMSLTRLGIALGELGVTLDVPEDIPYLGIKKGPIDIQRFFYWNICKMYYRPEFTIGEMNHVNFDWFRPLNCLRHTPDEVRAYCAGAGLTIERMDVQEAGITVVARKE